MLLVLATKMGPRNPDVVEIEYRFIYNYNEVFDECVDAACPQISAGVIIHAYLECYLLEWNVYGADAREAILVNEFDDNETEIYFSGADSYAWRPKYHYVSHSKSYSINQHTIISAFYTIFYDSANAYKTFGTGGREEIIQRVIRYTTDPAGYQDEYTAHNAFMRELFISWLQCFDSAMPALKDASEAT